MKLYGKNPVIERIRKYPGSIMSLYLQKRTDLSDIVKEAKKSGIAFESKDKDWFQKNCGNIHSQGVLAEVKEFEYVSFTEIMDDCLNNVSIPVFLDRITDPQNLGSIIRNLACLGGFSIVIPEHDSASVNETVLRVANGGENYIKICKVTNLVSAAKKAKEKQVWIAGTMVNSNNIITDIKLNFPLIIVIGSEGKGIRPGLEKIIDLDVALPMFGARISYNAAVAAILFCYETRRQWRGNV